MKPGGLLLALGLAAILLAACDRERGRSTDRDGIPAANARPHAPDAVAEPPAPARSSAPAIVDNGMSFTDMDRDMDGAVTRDELADTEALDRNFNEADSSGDGRLSYAEVERYRNDMAGTPPAVMTDGRSFAEMDRNGDAGVSRDELHGSEMLDRHFGEADGNRDGRLTAAEVDAHRAAMAAGN
jgi:Ca2+-binding EF-hand superfamily protein